MGHRTESQVSESTVPALVGATRTRLDRASAPAFEALFRQHYLRLVGALLVACGDRELAADVVQEAFAELWVNWNRISKYQRPSAWVARVAVNRLHDQRRSLRRKAAGLLRLRQVESAIEPPFGTAGEVAALFGRLPLRQRVAAVLYYLDDRSVSEVADIMGISEGAVNSHLHRAREALRSLLEER